MPDEKFLTDRRKTWRGFLWLLAVSATVSIVTMALLAYFFI